MANAAEHHMGRLENFLDTALRAELDTALARRDAVYTRASQCHQLRQLLKDIRRLRELDRAEESPGGQHGAEAAKAAVQRLEAANAAHSSGAEKSGAATAPGVVSFEDDIREGRVGASTSNNATDGSATAGGSGHASDLGPGGKMSVGVTSSFDRDPRLPTTILVDIGNHVYAQCDVPDARVVHVNIGAGVVLPMTHGEAVPFLVKKEQQLREEGDRRTKDVLKLRYRMRLVVQAIERLHQQIHGVGGIATA